MCGKCTKNVKKLLNIWQNVLKYNHIATKLRQNTFTFINILTHFIKKHKQCVVFHGCCVMISPNSWTSSSTWDKIQSYCYTSMVNFHNINQNYDTVHQLSPPLCYISRILCTKFTNIVAKCGQVRQHGTIFNKIQLHHHKIVAKSIHIHQHYIIVD